MRAAVTRYRVMAYVTGVWLLLLVLVAVPVKYIGHDPTLVGIVGPVHGILYIIYVLVTFDLSRRRHWALGYTVLVMLAGTIPFLSFVAERHITREIRRADAAGAQVEGQQAAGA